MTKEEIEIIECALAQLMTYHREEMEKIRQVYEKIEKLEIEVIE